MMTYTSVGHPALANYDAPRNIIIMFLGATIFKSLFLPPHTSPSIIEEETWLIRKQYSSMFTKSVGELFQNTATQQWSLSSFEEYILSQGVPYRLISFHHYHYHHHHHYYHHHHNHHIILYLYMCPSLTFCVQLTI